MDKLTNLTTLDLSHNRIERIENLQRNIRLVNLDLSHNVIDRIEGVSSLSSLCVLRLDYNRIGSIPDNLPPLISTLGLAQNQIVNVTNHFPSADIPGERF